MRNGLWIVCVLVLSGLPGQIQAGETAPADSVATPQTAFRKCEKLKVTMKELRQQLEALEKKLKEKEEALRNYRAVKKRNEAIILKLEGKK